MIYLLLHLFKNNLIINLLTQPINNTVMAEFLIDLFKDLSEDLLNLFMGWGLSYEWAVTWKNVINFILIIIVSAISWFIAKLIIIETVHKIVVKTENKYDDEIVRYKVVEPLSQIFPALNIYYLIQFAISDPDWVERIRNCCFAWNVFSVMLILMRAVDCLQAIVEQILEEQHRSFSTRGYKQVAKIVIGIVGGLMMIAVLTGRDPLTIVGGVAGMSAVMMFVFKDSLSGFVASIQLTSLNMVKMNDWITISNRNINGHVVDITLNTVKVRNFDNSVSTVPTAALMSESFINWSNMQDMQARRISRSIMIDADSVHIASEELIEKIKKIPIMTDYINQRLKDSQNPDDTILFFEKREISNLELFRVYIELYIKANYQVFVKYSPTTVIDSQGNINQVYYVDRDQFVKIHGKSSERFLEEDDGGNTFINDFRTFVKLNTDLQANKSFKKFEKEKKDEMMRRIYLQQDPKDDKVYYPFQYKEKNQYVNNELTEWKYPKKFLLKDGIFVENGHLMVRQMPQTSTGIPLEVYAFTKITEWASFEIIQSEFFEHLFSIIKEFNLRTFQFSQTDALAQKQLM